MSEFAFWPSSPPHKQGGIFEMRSYELVPGTLLEWETAWKRGLEARKRFVVSGLTARGVQAQSAEGAFGSNPRVLGSRRWDNFTRYTTCGRYVPGSA